MTIRMPFEFHVSRQARVKYSFDETMFATDGRVILADFSAARLFAEKMSKVRGKVIPASEINAMGLIDEVLHIIIRKYEEQNPGVMEKAFSKLTSQLGSESIKKTQLKFIEEFPPRAVYKKEISTEQYLEGSTNGRTHHHVTLEEMLILNITNLNPATHPYKELFDDSNLKGVGFIQLISSLSDFFNGERPFGAAGSNETLISILRAPAIASPYSLEGQLQFLIGKWGNILGDIFIQKLLRGMDFVREEAIRGDFSGGFAGEAPVIEFKASDYAEYERFSPDKDWMPNLILIAKNSYVWLDQLSKAYGREIRTLDAIPDEELERLAKSGITGLWLIGLWERSIASRTIKQMMGNAEAVASAYSLKDYSIANDLGGWQALENLRWRAWQKGIRLSADMVPNHMGIDSTWVVDHPDWFLSLPYPPYPSYSFNGRDLSDDSRVGVFLEDHYYDRSDASVVFKRLDRWSGDAQYIYHGNDGTSMPWNDTAQLNFLKAEVREAVIQTILHVARNFPIIRFDAAMTLAKRHIQRLWFPEPGSGGAIASRSEHGLTKEQFDQAIPEEFWREVVDRVATEVPDTLLLAEAFWMMESYFVRTLGMHRVYNSAFMHMLRDEDNAKYRMVIKNTLEFDPQILKRYVNFMNNPDEKTAMEQFGNGDKYFGVATMMATLPGLPMVGHGQIEGFKEKYGMEYRKAYWDESPDQGLMDHHERVVFPLMRKRYLFAEVDQFLLYDLYTPEGYVNEEVFAYSNGKGSEHALIIYHNKYAETRGWIKTSAGFMNKTSGQIQQRSLADGLDLHWNDRNFVIFHDVNSGLDFIRPVNELVEKGMYVELGSYKTHAFIDFREVYDEDGKWQQVHQSLNGAGYWSMQAKWDEMFRPAEELEEKSAKKAKKPRKTGVAKVAKPGTVTTEKPKTKKEPVKPTTAKAKKVE